MEITLQRLRASPLFWVSLAFLGGLLLASQVSLTSQFWLLGAGLVLLAGLVLRPWAARGDRRTLTQGEN